MILAMRLLLLPWLLLSLGCASTPPRESLAVLAQSEAELERGATANALALLTSVSEDSYTGDDLERYKLALTRARFAEGDGYGAFTVLRDYMQDHPLSSHVHDIERLTFEIGKQLIGSDRGFWIFWSDEDDGAYVLEHFVRRFSTSELAADAYHLLGESAFRHGRWDSAQQYYRQITMFHDRSAWVSKAMFRYAMAGYMSLVGPAYDLQRLDTVRRELEAFLATDAENVEYRREAEGALRTTRAWLGQKHVAIADFYARVDNRDGERYHLERAAADFADTEAGRDAKQRLATNAAALGVQR